MINNRIYDNDMLYQELESLVNPEFKAWYMKAFYILEKDRVREIAAIAKADGKQPKKLFSYLLKKEMLRDGSSADGFESSKKGIKSYE